MTILISCETKRHEILGTNYGWDASGIEVLLDAQIDKLRIRHVRNHNHLFCNSGYSEHIEIEGIIGPDSTAAVERLLPKLHKCIYDEQGNWYSNMVYLSSGGGFLHDGYEMGKLFRKFQIGTVITGGQECSSSCAIAIPIGLKVKFSLVNFTQSETAAKKATTGKNLIVIFGNFFIITYLDCSKALINSFSISDLISDVGSDL